ncbi:hypothetical protein [Autumnicola edwardsiae]|uniref:Uncharacterized protein n=1 Tax=Autumnicola edwardsiae TaxID=3075594 RepID=A0ABU3CXW0_9FLAO|nr:hypothetical protein [Zunongwangia sp. F297]MDT0651195.1 hypothetical protein [Zunongwangia sp. F297]
MKNSFPRHSQLPKQAIEVMNSNEKTLRILRSLRCKNLAHQKDYQHIAYHTERLLIKSFFRKISNSKKDFAAKLQQEIERIEKTLTLQPAISSNISSEEKCAPLFKSSRQERNGLIKECYRREKRNVHLYKYALAHVNEGSVREALLSQKSKTKSWLREIKCMGISIYEDSEKEHGISPFKFDTELKA